MRDLKACAVCLRTGVKLHSMAIENLRKDYNLVSGLKISKGKGFPEYLCVECVAYIRRFKKFRDKCHIAYYAMLELLSRNSEVDTSMLETLNRQEINIVPPLSYLNLANAHYETVKFKWVKQIRSIVHTGDVIPVQHCSTIEPYVIFEVPIIPEVPKDSDEVKQEEPETAYDNLLDESSHMDVDNDDFPTAEPEVEPLTTETNVEAAPDNNIEMLFDNIFGVNSDKEYDHLGNVITKDSEQKLSEEQDDVDGCQFEEEYATVTPLSMQEIKAVVDIYKMFGQGKFRCTTCQKSYHNVNRLQVHMRMHDTHTSGTFYCALCCYYYKTEFLLKTHISDKHMYKYVCKKCPEVSYDKTSAKQHYIWTHLQKGKKKNSNWYESNSRPSWLSNRGGNRNKRVLALKPVRKPSRVPKDFPKQTPIPQEEQYELIQQRKNSRNYKESSFKCQLCYRGFRELSTYSKHMQKHDPTQSGPLQCDMCKLHFMNTRKMYKHMRICHTYKYSCRKCTYTCYNRGSAHMHYQFHKNVTFKCPHCEMVFNKISTRLTHVRVKHPSTFICDLCGHSFVSETGLYYHKMRSHTVQEVSAPAPSARALYCAECGIQFRCAAAYTTHFGSSAKHAQTNISSKPVRTRKRPRGRGLAATDVVNNGVPTSNDCELCGETLRNDVAARKHYESAHPGADFLKRYMCDICGHITKQYANLMVHMRTHTQEKPYSCPHCDRKFSMVSNRDRHLVVHTGEKRYQCQHCNRRFTQSSAVKLHIQTVHLKIPYAPWDKKNRKRRKELENAATTVCLPAPPPLKYMGESGGDYLNAYINYNDE
ncbi:uncharacterized protein [Epargyreus clarus]|uniref:uncharacterized protein n=1 Tax=Epargyreus clarus TaxID=520877 RepID=UPI003C300E85